MSDYAISRLSGLALLALGLIATPAIADDGATDCRLTRYASLDIGTENPDRVIVPVTLNDHQVPLAIDTGSPTSMLSNKEANALSLDRQMLGFGTEIRMINGARIHESAIVPSFEIGGMKGRNFRLAVLPDHFLEPPAVGLLGADIVRNYDVDLDFAQNKVNLFARRHCPGQVVYWTRGPYATLPFHFDEGHHIEVPVKLDGVSLVALVDTGAPPAVSMSLERARHEFGWHDDQPGLHRVGGKRSPYTFPFGVLTLGGASVHQPTVVLRERGDGFGPDLLVGLAALKAFHVYISYEDQAIYLTERDAH
jgi:predicted aspartyl protease